MKKFLSITFLVLTAVSINTSFGKDSDEDVKKWKKAFLSEPKRINMIMSGKTALFRFSASNSRKKVEMMLSIGAKPNIQVTAGCCKGWTALMIAVAEGHVDIVEILLKNKADPNIKNDAGNTSIMFAVRYGYEKIFDLLVKNGASLNYGSEASQKPLFAALTSDLNIAMKIAPKFKLTLEDCREVNRKVCESAYMLYKTINKNSSYPEIEKYICKKPSIEFKEHCT